MKKKKCDEKKMNKKPIKVILIWFGIISIISSLCINFYWFYVVMTEGVLHVREPRLGFLLFEIIFTGYAIPSFMYLFYRFMKYKMRDWKAEVVSPR